MPASPVRTLLSLLAPLFVAVTLLAAPAPAQAAKPNGTFTVFAHRGLPNPTRTENTLPALNAVSNNGLRAAEIDVHITKDGQFLLMHDPTLDRTTTCRGKVADKTLAWIQNRCKGKVGREPLPTLGGALAWAETSGSRLIVEIKPSGGWKTASLTRLAATLTASKAAGRIIVHSYGDNLLRQIEAIAPAVHTQYISTTWTDASRVAPGVDGVNVYARYLTQARVSALHRQGKFVIGRNTTSASDWNKIHRLGADGLVTDAPVAAKPLERKKR